MEVDSEDSFADSEWFSERIAITLTDHDGNNIHGDIPF